MVINKFGETYRIESWGQVLNKAGVLKAMKPED
jgi:hypothetical protein